MICIGATRHNHDNSTTDLSGEFIKGGKVYFTYSPDVARAYDIQLKNLPMGTIIAIKAFSVQHGLYIKGVGIISDFPTENPIFNYRKVKWLWDGNQHYGRLMDKMDNMRSGAMYQELNLELVQNILELIPRQ